MRIVRSRTLQTLTARAETAEQQAQTADKDLADARARAETLQADLTRLETEYESLMDQAARQITAVEQQLTEAKKARDERREELLDALAAARAALDGLVPRPAEVHLLMRAGQPDSVHLSRRAAMAAAESQGAWTSSGTPVWRTDCRGWQIGTLPVPHERA